MTLGRATMNSAIGARRAAGAALPEPRARLTCDIFSQNCSRPELGCVLYPHPTCGLAGKGTTGQACGSPFACEKGLACVSTEVVSAAKPGTCQPYCRTDPAAANGCDVLCPGDYFVYRDASGALTSGVCRPTPVTP